MTKQIKIRFPLQNDVAAGETLWAERLERNRFRLLNVPFFVYGYAEGDVVLCTERDGWPEVVELIQDGGRGALRIIFVDSTSVAAQHILDELVSVGCAYERAGQTMVAVSVPPTLSVTFSQLSNYLNMEDTVIAWEIGKRPSGIDVTTHEASPAIKRS